MTSISRPSVRAPRIDKTAISPYRQYCDGYARPGATGNGYVSVVKVTCGQVEKTDDFLLDGIVAYDRAEANDAYIGQINMETASSFCGVAGNVWGFDLAFNTDLLKEKPVLQAKQYDGSSLPVFDARPLLDAGIALFGTEKNRKFPPAPGAHVICANKSTTNLRPAIGAPDPNKGEGFGVWAFIALSIARDRDAAADLFIEDAGVWTQDDDPANLKSFLDGHRKSVAWSIVACGKDQGVLYQASFIGYAYLVMEPGHIGTALTAAPYVSLARGAIPSQGFGQLYSLTLEEWEKSVES
jgi:histidine decarboxylase